MKRFATFLLTVVAAAQPAWAGDPGAAPASPEVPAGIAREVSDRAAERGVPAAEFLAPIAEAVGLGAPADLVAAKVLEGISKGVPPGRVAAVARDLTRRLVEADGILHDAHEAGLTPVADRRAALLDLCAALAAGVEHQRAVALLEAARSARVGRAEAVVSAAQAVGELLRRGVPAPEAMGLGTAIARTGPRPPGEVAALFDAWRAEGGKDSRDFVREATRRVESGRKLDGMVDPFAESPSRIVGDRGAAKGHEPGEVEGSDVGKHRADQGVGPAERPDRARGAVPGLDDVVHGKGKAKGKDKK
jgi:hypothetical protein